MRTTIIPQSLSGAPQARYSAAALESLEFVSLEPFRAHSVLLSKVRDQREYHKNNSAKFSRPSFCAGRKENDLDAIAAEGDDDGPLQFQEFCEIFCENTGRSAVTSE